MAWNWYEATPKERGEHIRRHLSTLGADKLRDLFLLTEDGVNKILNGDDWRPEYTVPDADQN